MPVQSWKFTVDDSEAGVRLDQLIAARTGLSRRKVRDILKLGGVQVARKRVRVASKLVQPGTEVRVALDEGLGALPDVDVPILFEDAWLLVVNKPAGMPTQGTQASDRHDLLAHLTRARPDQRLILCHRLDQGTSGVLVLAKDSKADVGPQFQERTLRKVYLARVSHPLEAALADVPIGRLRLAKPARFGCSGDLIDPKPASTAFRPAEAEEVADLLPAHWIVAEPRTGRTHQIRVHLAHLGAPVFGDGLYGGESSGQLWLHAWKLRLRHPVTDEELEWVAPPDRFRSGTVAP